MVRPSYLSTTTESRYEDLKEAKVKAIWKHVLGSSSQEEVTRSVFLQGRCVAQWSLGLVSLPSLLVRKYWVRCLIPSPSQKGKWGRSQFNGIWLVDPY
ncbi:hypothetical protein ACB092_01G110100 [Castanea dentata]